MLSSVPLSDNADRLDCLSPAQQLSYILRRPRKETERAAEARNQNRSKHKRGKHARQVSQSRGSGNDGSGDEAEGSATPAKTQAEINAAIIAAAPNKTKAAFDIRMRVNDRSAEKVLEELMEGWVSPVYDHFVLPPEIVVENGVVKHRFYCKFKPTSVFCTRVYYDESTSNFNRHDRECPHAPANATPESRALVTYVGGSQYSRSRHRLKIVIWIAHRVRPYSIIEDEELLDIFRDLHGPCKTVSRHTLSRDIIEVHGLTKEAVVTWLQTVEGKIHVSGDGWTAPNVISFIGVVVQFVEKASIVSLVLDFVKLTKAHTGHYLASRLAECLQEFGIDDRVMGFTGDNASNNDTLVSELEVLLPNFRGDVSRVRCACHILNLVAKAILSAFAKKMSADDIAASGLAELDDTMSEEDFDVPVPEEDRLAPKIEASDAAAVEDVIRDIESDMEADLESRVSPLSVEDAHVACVALTKLRKLAIKISNSPTLRDGLRDWCERTKIASRQLQKDVSTRWNSTLELAHSGRHLRPALDRMVVQAEYNKAGGARLRRFKPSDMLTCATKELSSSKKPLVHEVIPIIDTLTTFFDETIDDTMLHPTVRHAALRGLRMLNKYYSKTDESNVYRIAMMLHPHYKLDYFTKAGWEASWIAEARRIITAEWVEHYKREVPSVTTTASTSSASTSNDRFADIRERFNFHRTATATTVDPLEEWFATPPVSTRVKIDPIKYWSDMKLGGHPLAQMALDYLSVPATSTDVERAFSRGGLTVSKLRHSLSDQSTRCQTVLGVWCGVPGLVPTDKIIKVFEDKSKRSDGSKKAKTESSMSSHLLLIPEGVLVAPLEAPSTGPRLSTCTTASGSFGDLALTDNEAFAKMTAGQLYQIVSVPAQSTPRSTKDELLTENQMLQDIIDCCCYQMQWDHALKKLMEKENGTLQEQLFNKQNKPKKKPTTAYAHHMTGEECMEALAMEDWKLAMHKIFASSEFKAQKKKVKTELKEAEKQLERERKEEERRVKNAQREAERLEKEARQKEEQAEHARKGREESKSVENVPVQHLAKSVRTPPELHPNKPFWHDAWCVES
ncbi:hypothetical protein NMY22_g17397 [Coprinellus aureogranulatus]|nr:hypothetical protein NMY22_g17397 [Coprinellus aureogranulatus]